MVIRTMLAAGLATLACASADALPVPTIGQSVSYYFGPSDDHSKTSSKFGAINYNASTAGGSSAFAQSSVDGAMGGSVASTVIGTNAYITAGNNLAYTLRVFSFKPLRPRTVSVHITAHGRAGVNVSPSRECCSTLASAGADFFIDYGSVGEDGHAFAQVSGIGGSIVDDFDVDEHVFLTSNRNYQVFMSSNARLGDITYYGSVTPVMGYAFAYVDPVFTIDPGYDGFGLAFSPGIFNSVNGVPEPTSWMMLVAGFAVLGVKLRQRRVPAEVGVA